MSESGPAITLALTGGNVNGEIHLDLVPCFVLPDSQWPTTPFRANNVPDKVVTKFKQYLEYHTNTSISELFLRRL